MQFQNTKFVTLQSLENNPPKVGQWVNVDGAARGQGDARRPIGVAAVVAVHREEDVARVQRHHRLRLRSAMRGQPAPDGLARGAVGGQQPLLRHGAGDADEGVAIVGGVSGAGL